MVKKGRNTSLQTFKFMFNFKKKIFSSKVRKKNANLLRDGMNQNFFNRIISGKKKGAIVKEEIKNQLLLRLKKVIFLFSIEMYIICFYLGGKNSGKKCFFLLTVVRMVLILDGN